jgi:tetratricopeptide (TPR) repeat protein
LAAPEGTKLEERVAECDLVLAREGESPDLVSRRRVAQALVAKGAALRDLGRREDAKLCVERVIEEFGDAEDEQVRGSVAVALYDKGRLLAIEGRLEDALESWDLLLERFAIDPPRGAALVAIDALYAKALALRQLGRDDETVGCCEELIEGYGDDERLGVRVAVAKAMWVKRDVFAAARRGSQVLAVDDELIERFAGAKEPLLRKEVALALRDKVRWLLASRRVDEAIAVTEQLVARFDGESDKAIQLEVGGLLVEAGEALLYKNRFDQPRKEFTLRLLAMVVGLSGVGRRWLLGGRGLHSESNQNVWRAVAPQCRRYEQARRVFAAIEGPLTAAGDAGSKELLAKTRLQLGAANFAAGRQLTAVAEWRKAFELGVPTVEALQQISAKADKRSGLTARAVSAAALLANTMALNSTGRSD